ncbi:MAG TPA: J domain-containing protein, partial [Phycisphaerae bacterium]|nr:J domain-containing protein [Phycisphaerae bacterium]
TPSQEHFRVLGLPRSAGPHEVRAAFRTLVKSLHPDLNSSPTGRQRFIQVVQAYRALQEELDLLADGPPLRICPRCGRRQELLDGLDGGVGCVDCLLGETPRRRYLPLPVIETVRHVSVVSLYALSLVLVARAAVTGHLGYALGSLAAAALGLLVLAATCVRVREAK